MPSVLKNVFIGHETTSVQCVCTQGDLACDLGKTQQAGAMMQPVTAWLSLFCLEKTTHLPPNPLKQLSWRKSATSYMQNLRNVVWNFVQNGQTGAWTHHQSLDVLRLRKRWFSYRCPGRHNSQSVSQKLKTWKTNYFCFPFAFLC